MTKAIMNSILSLIATIDTPEADEVRTALTAELSKGAERAKANADLYASAKPVIFGVLSEIPVTIAEIYEAVKGELPDGFTKSKVQYAITRLWADEIVKTEDKVNAYSLKA